MSEVKLEDRYEIRILWSDQDESYVAYIPDFPYMGAHGNTYEAALKQARSAIAGYLSLALSAGKHVPEPGERAGVEYRQITPAPIGAEPERALDNRHNLRTTPGNQITPLEDLECRVEDLLNGMEMVRHDGEEAIVSVDKGDLLSLRHSFDRSKKWRIV